MSPRGPNANIEYRDAIRRRLREFNRRTRQRAMILTGRQEIARSGDPQEILRELLDNWPGLESLLVRHGAFYPLIDKARRIRNDVTHGTGTFTRSEKSYVNAMISIGMLETAVRSAGAEEGRRRKWETESSSVRCNATATSCQPAGEFPR